MSNPITSTRLAPAGVALPGRAPGPGDVPPWRVSAPTPTPAEDPKHDEPTDTTTHAPDETEAPEEETTPPQREHRIRDPRLRWAAFNGSAAAAGHLAIWSLTGDPMAGAAYMGRMSISVPELSAAGLTAGCLVAGWQGAKLVQLHRIPGPTGLATRPVTAVAAAMWGQGTAPLVRDAMTAIEPWGTILAPLLAVGPVAAAMWWGLDRRARAAQLVAPVRWLARIPLATTTLSALLYAPGALQ